MICKRHCERDATIHKQGFTLMELLIYMAIVGIVVVVAGQAFSNSTKFRVRTDNMIRATQEAENVGMLFKTDAEQLGTKNAKESGAAGGGSSLGDNFGIVHENVYMDPANNDYSSFLVSSEGAYSDFTFRRLRYDANGYSALTSLTLVAADFAGTLAGSTRTLTITYGTVTPLATLDNLFTFIISGMRRCGRYAMAARCGGC